MLLIILGFLHEIHVSPIIYLQAIPDTLSFDFYNRNFIKCSDQSKLPPMFNRMLQVESVMANYPSIYFTENNSEEESLTIFRVEKIYICKKMGLFHQLSEMVASEHSRKKVPKLSREQQQKFVEASRKKSNEVKFYLRFKKRLKATNHAVGNEYLLQLPNENNISGQLIENCLHGTFLSFDNPHLLCNTPKAFELEGKRPTIAIRDLITLLPCCWLNSDIIHMSLRLLTRSPSVAKKFVVLEYSRLVDLFNDSFKKDKTQPKEVFSTVYNRIAFKKDKMKKKKRVLTLLDKRFWLVAENLNTDHWLLQIICNPISLVQAPIEDKPEFEPKIITIDSQCKSKKTPLNNKSFWAWVIFVYFTETDALSTKTVMTKKMGCNVC